MSVMKISLCFISLLLISQTVFTQEGWELKKNEDNIKIYTSKQANSAYKKFKAEAVLACKPMDMVTVLKDVDSYYHWIADCETAELLKRDSFVQYHYIETALPWPLDNRDMVYKFEYNISDTSNVQVKIEGVPNYIDEKKGIVRMSRVVGEWTFESVGNNNTKVVYILHSEPGGEIPAWLANTSVVDMPFNSITALKHHLNTFEVD